MKLGKSLGVVLLVLGSCGTDPQPISGNDASDMGALEVPAATDSALVVDVADSNNVDSLQSVDATDSNVLDSGADTAAEVLDVGGEEYSARDVIVDSTDVLDSVSSPEVARDSTPETETEVSDSGFADTVARDSSALDSGRDSQECTVICPGSNESFHGSVEATALLLQLRFNDNLEDSSGNAFNGVMAAGTLSYSTNSCGSRYANFNRSQVVRTSVGRSNVYEARTTVYWFEGNPTNGQVVTSSLGFSIGSNGPSMRVMYSDRYTLDLPVPATFAGWHHWAVVSAANMTRIYLDGSLAAEGSTPMPQYPGITVRIGGLDNSTPNLRGGMDDYRLYNRALTAAEIAALYRGARRCL